MKPEPHHFYLAGKIGDSAMLLKVTGVEARPANMTELQHALRLGVLCLNSGKSDREIYTMLESTGAA